MPLKKNARFMSREQFSNLVENIKRDGDLSSVPFCIVRDGQYHVLSGNHRVKAAVAAGLNEILVMYTEEQLPREQEVAIQLSHNAIAGQDDQAMLKELFNEINDLALKSYSGLDDKLLGQVDALGGSGFTPVRLDFRTVTFLMLPDEESHLDGVLEAAADEAKRADTAYLARLGDFDRFMKAISRVQKAENIKNAAVALAVILDTFEKAYREPTDESEATGTEAEVR